MSDIVGSNGQRYFLVTNVDPSTGQVVPGGVAPKATSAPTTSVASSATSVTLLALNASRKWASFRNDSTSVAYIAKSATATTSSVYLLQPQGYLYFDDYTGVVSAIWASANGFMRIEEGA